MPPFDGAAFGKDIVTQVKKYVETVTAPLLKEIAVLRTELETVKSVDHSPAIAQAVGEILVLRLNDTANDVETRVRSALPDVATLVRDAFADTISGMPSLDDIKIAAVTELKPVLATMLVEAVQEIPVPKDGRDGRSIKKVELSAAGHLLVTTEEGGEETFTADLGLIVGQNGSSVDPEAVSKTVDEAVQKAVSAIRLPVDGIGIKTASLDANGSLKFVLSDDSEIDVGRVVGQDGINVDMKAVDASIHNAVNSLPKPVSVRSATINGMGELVFDLSNDDQLNVGLVVGKDADAEALFTLIEQTIAAIPVPQDGRGIKSAHIADNGGLVIEFTDGVKEQLGFVVGKDGQDSDSAAIMQSIGDLVASIPTPADGVGLVKFEMTEAGALVIHTSDGKTHDVGVIRGKDATEIDPIWVDTIISEKLVEALKQIPTPKDGVGIDNIELDAEKLIFTLTSGRTVDLGRVVGKDGVGFDIAEAQRFIAEKLIEEFNKLPVPTEGRGIKDVVIEDGSLRINFTDDSFKHVGFIVGKDADEVDLDAVKGWVTDEVTSQIKSIPVPENGKDGVGIVSIKVDKDELLVQLSTDEVINTGRVIFPGADGKDVDMDELAELIKAEIETMPKPENGVDGIGIKDAQVNENGEFVITFTNDEERKFLWPKALDAATVAKEAAALIPAPKDGADGADGVGVAGAMIDRDGELIVTNTLGQPFKLGRVVGKDADPVDENAIVSMVSKAVEALPKPVDGLDGVGFENMDVLFDEETKELVISGEVADTAKQWKLFLPVLVDRGVYSEKHGRYLKGDGVTFSGSFWIAQKETDSRPGEGNTDWRLSVKKGRDAKDIVKIVTNEPAPPIKLGD